MVGDAAMMNDVFPIVIAMSLVCVPIVWFVPRDFAFDAVALWTLTCLSILSPPTAILVVMIAVVLPFALGRFGRYKNRLATVLILCLVMGLIVTRVVPGPGWIGIIFLTLRALHVVIEWWMGRLVAPSLRESLHYFMFLPVLVSGPINRQPHFQRQLQRRRWDVSEFMTGAERVLLGLVSIWFVAGYLIARFQLKVTSFIQPWPDFWSEWALSAVGWISLYFVFSGATHVALGVSQMMGLVLEENFDKPWKAQSLIEFWRRWHMSLTSWVQDYVFRPLTALTRNPVLGLIAAMLVVGLWHAFSIYYVLWSFWQSLGILFARMFARKFAGLIGDRTNVSRATVWFGPLSVFLWLTAAAPMIGLLGISP
jgi:D-alanyl-lipoteichoic acid acyltransferase DltB (MBOAT superfamily)